MEDAKPGVERLVLELLRAAREPVRESVLYERVQDRGQDVTPEFFLVILERLATLSHLHVAVDHELSVRDPAPFEARFWHVVE